MAKDLEKVKKEDWLKEFSHTRPDLFFPQAWSEKQKEEAIETVRPTRMRTSMFSSIPMNCTRACPVIDTCPLYKKNLAPLDNTPCPIEMSMVIDFTTNFMEYLNVEPDNLIEASMVRSMVDQEIQYIRKTKLLAKESFIQENIVGVDENNKPILKKELHLAVELEDRIHKRLKDLRAQLMATRQQKAKIGQGSLDTAQTIANIMDELRGIDIAKQNLLKAKLNAIDVDDFEEIEE